VSGSWLDIRGPEGTRREVLREGVTRLGGPGADIVIPGVGADQLHVWNRPPRVLFLGSGARPLADTTAFDDRLLKPGDAFEWAGHRFLYGGEAASEHQASLEELPSAQPVASVAPAGSEARLLARLRAGLACDLALVDGAAAKRWREAVQAGRFDADLCARELLARPLGAEAEQRLLERAGTLQRDFLMAPLLSGPAAARRKLRESSRGLVAFLLTQGLALVIFTMLIAAALLVLRGQGRSIDSYLDRLLPK
jgi:hypothetical protein